MATSRQHRAHANTHSHPGVARDDSDDELGDDDLPWEFIYRDAATSDPHTQESTDPETPRKRKRLAATAGTTRQAPITGARNGTFECRVGDCLLLKAEGSNEAWVAIATEFIPDDDDGDMAANFLWFSTHSEIRNNDRKRSDHLPNELYITPSSDINPLASINGKATVMSPARFHEKYPSGKVPRSSPDYNKVFICRRGCNTRTTTYTDEFVWEDIYGGHEDDIAKLRELVQKSTQSTRKRRKPAQAAATAAASTSDDPTYVVPPSGDQDEDIFLENEEGGRDTASRSVVTPRKRQKTNRIVTPSSRR